MTYALYDCAIFGSTPHMISWHMFKNEKSYIQNLGFYSFLN